MQHPSLYFSTHCTHTTVKTQCVCAKVHGNACEGKQRFRNPLSCAKAFYVTLSMRTQVGEDVRLDRNTLDLSLLPGVHKAAVALRCMHVPDLSHSKGEAKCSTNEELVHDVMS